MASQRITIAKIGGVSSEIVSAQLGGWFAARTTTNPNSWSPDQWPDHVRKATEKFADKLRVNGLTLPVCYFVEWVDFWSMVDLFSRWLTPPDCPGPISIYADRFELFAYTLPDGGRLTNHLSVAGPQQHSETEWFISRLREAVHAWADLTTTATLIVLRQVLDGSLTDEDALLRLSECPDWLL